jgi:hypothetical protein
MSSPVKSFGKRRAYGLFLTFIRPRLSKRRPLTLAGPISEWIFSGVFPKLHAMKTRHGGPDLAFIRIPKDTNFESELRAVRINFYSFARDTQIRLARALDESNSLLAVAGAPVEMIKDVSPSQVDKRGIVEFPVFLAPAFKYKRKENGHDFFDVPVDRELGVRVPNFFTGVSGGPAIFSIIAI